MINGLPERLKEQRAQHKFSQRYVAQKLGVSPSIVSGYETGERTPSTNVLLQLSYLYGCSTDYLLGKCSATPELIDCSGLTDEQIATVKQLIRVMHE